MHRKRSEHTSELTITIDDISGGLHPDRVREIRRRLAVGSDARFLLRGAALARRARGISLAILGGAVVGALNGSVPAATMLLAFGPALASVSLEARLDVTRRRLRWSLAGAAACDRAYGPAITNQRLDAARGDFLKAASLTWRTDGDDPARGATPVPPANIDLARAG